MRQPWAELIRRRTPSFIESVIAWPRRIWTPTTASPAWGGPTLGVECPDVAVRGLAHSETSL